MPRYKIISDRSRGFMPVVYSPFFKKLCALKEDISVSAFCENSLHVGILKDHWCETEKQAKDRCALHAQIGGLVHA